MPPSVEIVRQPLLDGQERLLMLRLHRRYFDNVRQAVFMRDMDAKDWVIVLRTPDRDIVGFSTLHFVTLRVGDCERGFLFSGDTVVARPFRRSGALAGAFVHVMLHMLECFPGIPCYWLLVSKGYRTYRYLPLYFQRFFPAYDRVTPPLYTQLLCTAGEHLFGHAYDADAGIVRHAGDRDHLTAEAIDMPAGRLDDPHVTFFLERNPHFDTGDELACIADISRSNLGPTCHRLAARTRVRWITDRGTDKRTIAQSPGKDYLQA